MAELCIIYIVNTRSANWAAAPRGVRPVSAIRDGCAAAGPPLSRGRSLSPEWIPCAQRRCIARDRLVAGAVPPDHRNLLRAQLRMGSKNSLRNRPRLSKSDDRRFGQAGPAPRDRQAARRASRSTSLPLTSRVRWGRLPWLVPTGPPLEREVTSQLGAEHTALKTYSVDFASRRTETSRLGLANPSHAHRRRRRSRWR